MNDDFVRRGGWIVIVGAIWSRSAIRKEVGKKREMKWTLFIFNGSILRTIESVILKDVQQRGK